MGFNYYMNLPDGTRRHIGKSSRGWCFAMHVDDAIQDFNALCRALWHYGECVCDEEGDPVHRAVLLEDMLLRGMTSVSRTQEYLRVNHAVMGPNGLLRSEISVSSRCVGHAAGGLPIDYIEGEFS